MFQAILSYVIWPTRHFKTKEDESNLEENITKLVINSWPDDVQVISWVLFY